MKFFKIIFLIFLLGNFLNLQSQDFITEKDAPFFELYENVWNTEHVRPSKTIVLPEDYVVRILFEDYLNFSMPCSGKLISDYGPRGESMHTGVDLKQNLNDPIYSCFDGVVRMATTYYGYGKIVVIRHYNGLETVYAHLNNIAVKLNQKVKAGQVIGYAGRTGRATTEHLHFEVRFLYKPYNPNLFFDFEKGALKRELYVFETISPQDSLLANFSAPTEPSTSQESSVQKPEPPVKEESVKEEPVKETPIKAPPAKPATVKTKIHTVVKGETVFSISQRYGMTVAELRTLNKIGSDNLIHVGQELKVK